MICKKCGEDKPANKFNPHAKTCRKCCIEKQKKRPQYHVLRSLNAAKRRCRNPKDAGFKYYGAKGIKYEIDSKEFIRRFLPTWADMMAAGMAPSIDRIDPTKNYTIDNVRIVDKTTNTKEGNLSMQIAWLKKRKISKKCKDCNKEFPCTLQYFHSKGKRKDGSSILGPRCKGCHRIYARNRAHKRGYWDKRDKD